MSGHDLNMKRLPELLADEAAGTLATDERRELEVLLRHAPAANREEFLAVTGLVQLGFLKKDPRGMRKMPARLEAGLMDQSESWPLPERAAVADLARARQRRAAQPAGAASPAPAPRAGRWDLSAMSGWAAAAALAIAFIVTGRPGPSPTEVQQVAGVAQAAERSALLRNATDVVTVYWKGSPGGIYAGVHGDVVWSDSRQAGYLRVAGLPANDRARGEYQLWIVAPDRDTHPVDGGVFDVTKDGESIIPIHAKLNVRAPKAFAITFEQPGGVVVSKGPMLAVAAVSA